MASTPEHVRIHYIRPPDREEVFVQRVIERTPACVVTYQEHVRLRRPVRAGGQSILEPDSPAIWFTFPGLHHDIGRFHLRDGTFTGVYANVLTPVLGVETDRWVTTDLFLDVWQWAGGTTVLLDEDELQAAIERGWLDRRVAASARAEADRLLDRARAGAWPPEIVAQWTLERVRASIAGEGE